MYKQLIIAISFLALLSGCVTNQPISSTTKSSVNAVEVSKDIAVPDKMYYVGPGGTTGMVFGAIGGALSASSIESGRADFQNKAVGSEAVIRAIVTEEMLAKIRESGKFPSKSNMTQDVNTLYISVLQYGFSVPHGFSSSLVPIVAIRCELKNSSGKVLWSATEGTRPLGNPVDSITADTIRQNSAIRDAAWRSAVKAVAKKIVDSY